jgi:hypothetical protein
VQVGAINLSIELELRDGYSALDISGATTKQIIIDKPDGTNLTRGATFTTDGKDGKLYYLTVAGDLDQAGDYRAQSYIIIPGFNGYSSATTFTVYANI